MSAIPPRKEVPHPTLPAADTSSNRPCWRFTHVDHDGPWGFDQVEPPTLCGILKKLAHFESMTISQLFDGSGYPGKEYDVPAIPNKTALARLDDLRLADQTKISVLRLGGEERLYGFRRENIFHVVWWDPKHEIWPSPKKHT